MTREYMRREHLRGARGLHPQPTAMPTEVNLQSLFGLTPFSDEIKVYLSTLASSSLSATSDPEVKAYSDAIYFNHFALGLSLLFGPVDGYKPKPGAQLCDLDQSRMQLRGIDIYNVPTQKPDDKTNSSRTPSNAAYCPYPISPIVLALSPDEKDGQQQSRRSLEVNAASTGKDFVSALGEPDRKGGGSGPSSGSIGIWLEWNKYGLMVEYGGDESRGPQAWEKGKDARWSVLSIFPGE
jgi:hypothetical protein